VKSGRLEEIDWKKYIERIRLEELD